MRPAQVDIPSFVRIKPGAIQRLGIYAQRHHRRHPAVLSSHGLPSSIMKDVLSGLASQDVEISSHQEISDTSFDAAEDSLAQLPNECDSIFGLGGGKALDLAKYVASLADLPYYSVPTSLSNDGFCAPQSSLLLRGRRKSLACRMPYGIVVDTTVCSEAPDMLWWSGVGDLIAKLTAVQDWKIAYHECGEPVDDLAALLSTSTVYQFIARPNRDPESIQIMACALMLNGVSMAICGSSRPASGAEHLISHAVDQLTQRPRYHGLQVGVAAYITSQLHKKNSDTIAQLFDTTRFWQGIRQDPFSREEWIEAVNIASSLKPGRYTVLDRPDSRSRIVEMLHSDPQLLDCFV